MTTLGISLGGLAFLVLVFIAAAVLAYAIVSLLMPGPEQRRLEAIGAAASEPNAHGPISRWVGTLARASTPGDHEEIRPTRLRLWRAGFRSPGAVVTFYAVKTFLTVALPLLMLAYAGLTPASESTFFLVAAFAVTAAAGYYLPDLVLSHLIAHRQQDLFFAFPDALDVMRICVEAGLSLDAAIQRVARDIRLECPALSDELHQVSLELRAGASRRQALMNLATRVKLDDVDALVSMLVQADRFGASIADALRVHSESLRTRRRLAAEERAAKLPVKLLVPLVLFIFPSLLTVLLGPAAISVYRILLPTIVGK